MTKENFNKPSQGDSETEEVKNPDFNIENEVKKTRAEEFEERKPEVIEKIDKEVDELGDEEVKQELEKRGLPVDMSSKKRNREQLKQVRLGRAETMAGLRDKLNEFKQSRQRFVEAENNLKKYKGIKGALKMGGDAEASVQEEYDRALVEYEEKRAEYVGEKVSRMLNQQTELVKTRAENFVKEKGLSGVYEGYKKLGKWNLGALLGDKVMEKFDRKEGDGKVKRFFKGTARFFTKTLSVRMGLSMGLLGAGFVLGGGVGFVGALAARRALSGLGAGFGTYDLMKMFGARKEMKKGMRKELSEEELKTIELSEITDRMSHFEQEAEASGDANVLDNKTYISLKIEFNSRVKETKAEDTGVEREEMIKELIEHADKNLERVRGEAKKKELKRKGIAVGVGLFVGSGAFGEALGAGKTYIADLIKGDEAIGEVAEQLSGTGEAASSVAVEQELLKQTTEEYTIGPIDTVGEAQGFDIVAPDTLSESSKEVYNHLKDIISGAEGDAGPTIIRAQAMDTVNQLKTAAPEQWEEILENHGKEIVPSEQELGPQVTDEKMPETPVETKIISTKEGVSAEPVQTEQLGERPESQWDITAPEDIDQDTFNELQDTIKTDVGPTQAKAAGLNLMKQLQETDPDKYQEMLDGYKASLEIEKAGLIRDLTGEAAPAVEQLDYQGGDSVWSEVENQLQTRTGFKDLFTGGDKAGQTHAIDYFKDKIVANPQEYGLEEGVDFKDLSAEDLKNIDWNKLLSVEEGEIDKVFPGSTEAVESVKQPESIIPESLLAQEETIIASDLEGVAEGTTISLEATFAKEFPQLADKLTETGFFNVDDSLDTFDQSAFNKVQELASLTPETPADETLCNEAKNFLQEFKDKLPEVHERMSDEFSKISTEAGPVEPVRPVDKTIPIQDDPDFKKPWESVWTEPTAELNQETFNELQKTIEENAGPTVARLDALGVLEELEKSNPEKYQEMLDGYKASLIAERDILVDQLAGEQVLTTEHLDYQGGNSVWREVENQLQERTGLKDIFTGGDEAEQTHAIDYFKDKIVANPQEYGLAEGVDPDKLTPEQLKNIDWDKLLSVEEDEIDKAFPELTEAAKQNIVENNRILQEYVSKTGESLDTDTVDQVLKDVKEAGSVDEYLKPEEVEPEPIALNEMDPEDMTPAEQELLENYNKYLETDVSGRAARAAQDTAKDFLDSQSPEVYNKYTDVKEAIQHIRVDDLTEELNEGRGLLRFGRPDTDDLMIGVQKLAETVDLSEKESNLFSNWLAGEDGILKKNDFVDLMTDRELDEAKFLEKIQNFNEIVNSKDLPDTYAWEPRHIYTGEGAEKIEQLVNIREVQGGYQIDSTGNGMPDEGTVYQELAVKQMMSKEAINTAEA